jgi:hypothetical protein
MQAHETIEVEAVATEVRGACLAYGCPCKDARIVSYRRAGFFAAIARRRFQNADRVVAPEPGWRIPRASVTGPESRLIVEATNRRERSEHEDSPTFIHAEIEQ